MFMILTYGEYDSQSSKKAWEVWYPYLEKGFASLDAARERIAQNGAPGAKYHIVEVTQPVTPQRTVTVSAI